MAAKKPSFPSKACPKCKALIHARSHSHEKCGWEMKSAPKPSPAKSSPAKKRGRPAGKKAASGGSISLADIQAVKKLTDKIGADKVKDIAEVLG